MKFSIPACCLGIFLLLPLALAAEDLFAGMVFIPAGDALLGSNKTDDEGLSKRYGTRQPFFNNEHPQHTQHIAAFYIDQYEVSNRAYREYLKATGAATPRHWIENTYALSLKREQIVKLPIDKLLEIFSTHITATQFDNTVLRIVLLHLIDDYWKNLDALPVEGVSWHQARDYCQFKHKRLPSEAEWEKTARGDKGLEFPWGNEWHAGWSNTIDQDWPNNSAPPGSYKTDKSPYGVFDLAGNVHEWVDNWYQPYPNSKDSDPDYGESNKIVRGGGYGSAGHYYLPMFSRGAYRNHLRPDSMKAGIGFRCAKDE